MALYVAACYVLLFLVLSTFVQHIGANVKRVTLEQQKYIVDAHNAIRRQAAANATNMMKMVWDQFLADQALIHAQRYTVEHDKYYERYVDELPGVATGQNICFGPTSWENCLNSWFQEIQYFQHGVGSSTGNSYDVLHISQVLYWKSSRIGCARTYCGCVSYFVCNYAYSLVWTEFVSPWTEGISCADCLSCDDGLCDCGGLMCMNDGTTDLSTCSCECQNSFSGTQCENLSCDIANPSYCDNYIGPDQENKCQQYTNLRNVCPKLCDRC